MFSAQKAFIKTSKQGKHFKIYRACEVQGSRQPRLLLLEALGVIPCILVSEDLIETASMQHMVFSEYASRCGQNECRVWRMISRKISVVLLNAFRRPAASKRS